MVNPYETPRSDVATARLDAEPFRRHGCLTAYLAFMIVVNSLVALNYAIGSVTRPEAYLDVSTLQIVLLLLCLVGNVVFAIALFNWRRWGFYGFIVTTILSFAINVSIGMGFWRSVFGFVGILVLYAVLQIGGDRRAWPRLQ